MFVPTLFLVRACARALVLAASAGASLLLTAAAVAGPLPEYVYRDAEHTMQARKLLADDPQLGPLNLGVKVKDRVAVLWGPVPSLEAAARAEQRLRVMFELIQIRNHLYLEDDHSPARTPQVPQFLPERLPAEHHLGPRRPMVNPEKAADVARHALSEATVVHSSPVRHDPTFILATTTPIHLRLPFLGTVSLPR